ncbi:MAG: hypothetical protein JRJ19_16120 [Deltaproteobacteria bacterium]|nr:hypothetical protein [Deltaproteobacteria bacterium]MBW1873594.1 hypothetical protein [Deltaproteobacteria bacterium]
MRLAHLFVWMILACGTSLNACGGTNDCEKAVDIRAEAYTTSCQAKTDDCCICKCVKQGLVTDPQAADCTCIETPDLSCRDAVLQAAKECIENETQCKSDVADLVELVCPS